MREEENYWTTIARRRMTRRQMLRAATLAGVTAAGAGMLGCDSSTPRSSTTTGGTTPTAPASSGTPAKVVPTGTLTAAKDIDLDSLDPQAIVSGYNWDYGLSVFEGLLIKDLDGKMVPGLATSWKVAEDGKSINFNLRKGVKWHNGDPFTAEDVRFSLGERVLSPEVKSTVASNFTAIDKVEVVDDYQVTIRLKSPDASILYNIEYYGFIAPAKYLKAVGNAEFLKRPIGTGPFKFVKWSPGESWELEAFEDHWGRVPSVKKVVVKIVPEPATRVAMLKTGEVDMTILTATHLKDVESTRGLQVIRTPSLAVRMSLLNGDPAKDPTNKSVPLRNKLVRQAINYAIDKKALLSAIYNGEGVMVGSPLGPGSLGFDPNSPAPYPYDPQKAKALLAQAGYADGFELEIVASPPTGDMRKEAEAMDGYLKAVGFKTKITGQEHGKVLDDMRQKRYPPIAVNHAALNATGDVGAWLPRHCMSGGTWCSIALPELDDMIKKLMLIYDPTERAKYIGKIMQLQHDEATNLFLFAPNVFYGLRDKWEWQTVPGRYVMNWWNVKAKK